MDYLEEISSIVAVCRTDLDLTQTEEEPQHLHHPCIPIIILDAVFSINAWATVVGNVIRRYRDHAGIGDGPEQTIDDFVSLLSHMGTERFAREVLENRQRTSAQAGVLKAEAALQYALVLKDFGVNCRADLHRILDSDRFCRRIRLIPGQAISLDYFLMMAGRIDLVKPDRMVQRFVGRCLNEPGINPPLAAYLLARAADELRTEYNHLTPRLLDWIVWSYERSLDE